MGRFKDGGTLCEGQSGSCELLFMKIVYGAFRGAALRPRGEGCFTVEGHNNSDMMVFLLGCRLDLHWLGGGMGGPSWWIGGVVSRGRIGRRSRWLIHQLFRGLFPGRLWLLQRHGYAKHRGRWAVGVGYLELKTNMTMVISTMLMWPGFFYNLCLTRKNPDGEGEIFGGRNWWLCRSAFWVRDSPRLVYWEIFCQVEGWMARPVCRPWWRVR